MTGEGWASDYPSTKSRGQRCSEGLIKERNGSTGQSRLWMRDRNEESGRKQMKSGAGRV